MALHQYRITVPPDVKAGESFYARIEGNRVKLSCPSDLGPDRIMEEDFSAVVRGPMQRWTVTVPTCLGLSGEFMATLGSQKTIIKAPKGSVSGTKLEVQVPSCTQFFDVQVPYDANPGTRFSFHCGSIDALASVVCPPEHELAADCLGVQTTICVRVKGVTGAAAYPLKGSDECALPLPYTEDYVNEPPNFISTGSRPLDDLLGGGLRIGAVTELLGAHGVGKSLLGLKLATRCYLPRQMGGGEGVALYLDAAGSFSSADFRLHVKQLAATYEIDEEFATDCAVQHVLPTAGPPCADESEENAGWEVIGVTNSELLTMLSEARSRLCDLDAPPVRLVVIDSVAVATPELIEELAMYKLSPEPCAVLVIVSGEGRLLKGVSDDAISISRDATQDTARGMQEEGERIARVVVGNSEGALGEARLQMASPGIFFDDPGCQWKSISDIDLDDKMSSGDVDGKEPLYTIQKDLRYTVQKRERQIYDGEFEPNKKKRASLA